MDREISLGKQRKFSGDFMWLSIEREILDALQTIGFTLIVGEASKHDHKASGKASSRIVCINLAIMRSLSTEKSPDRLFYFRVYWHLKRRTATPHHTIPGINLQFRLLKRAVRSCTVGRFCG